MTDIAISGPRATLVTDLEANDSVTVGVCRAAAGGGDDPVANLPGVSQLLIKTTDGQTQDCADL